MDKAILFSDHLQPGDPYFGQPVACYVCAAQHEASAVVRIVQDGHFATAAVCDACLADADIYRAVARKFLKLPDIDVGWLNTEQAIALLWHR